MPTAAAAKVTVLASRLSDHQYSCPSMFTFLAKPSSISFMQEFKVRRDLAVPGPVNGSGDDVFHGLFDAGFTYCNGIWGCGRI